MTSKRPRPLPTASALALTLILASCAIPPPQALDRGGQAPTNVACAELPALSFSEGKPGATAADVEAAIAAGASSADPLAWVRNVVGDTTSTRAGIANYVARRTALGCTP